MVALGGAMKPLMSLFAIVRVPAAVDLFSFSIKTPYWVGVAAPDPRIEGPFQSKPLTPSTVTAAERGPCVAETFVPGQFDVTVAAPSP